MGNQGWDLCGGSSAEVEPATPIARDSVSRNSILLKKAIVSYNSIVFVLDSSICYLICTSLFDLMRAVYGAVSPGCI